MNDDSFRTPTLVALDAFRGRRRRLLQARAALAAVVVILSAILVIALLDRLRFMPEMIRPWVSLMTYAGAAFAAWHVALRYLREASDDLGAARLLEIAEPALRERLLSAVELSNSRGHDSLEFRERLQQEVDQSMATLDLHRLLPVRALQPWILSASGVFLLVLLLCFVPRLHLPGFVARAAVPFADFARPASLTIKVIVPAPASALVPIASEVEIAVEIEGSIPKEVHLETVATGGRPRLVEMLHQGGTRYEGLIAIGQSDVRYRIHAADAISAWETLSARPRPRVLEFTKTIIAPAYTGLVERNITEDHGDLEALDGSTIKLTLTTNHPVSKSELVLNPDQPGHPEPKAMAVTAQGSLSGEVIITAAYESWQVKLTGKETGFTNDASAPWRITVIPDLPPVVQIIEPQEQLQLLADEAVRLSGSASDDVGLKSVQLSYAVNGAGWHNKDLVLTPGRESPVQSTLPLGPLNVKPGDTVLLKLLATDSKGQTAETPPVRVIILDQTVDPQVRQWAVESRRLAQQTETLAEKTKDLRRAMEQVQKSTKAAKKGQPLTEPETALAAAKTQLQQVTERADDLWNQLKQAAVAAPTQLDSTETLLLGERVAQMRRESLEELKKATAGDIESTEMLRRSAQEASGTIEMVSRAARLFAAEANARVLSQEAQQLHRQENLLTDNALQSNRDAVQRPQWQEQQRAAITAAAGIRQNAALLVSQLDHGQQRQIEELNKQVTEASNDLRDSLDKPNQSKSPEHLYGAADNLRQRLGRTAEAARNIAEQVGQQAAQERERLQRSGNPAIIAMEKARGALAMAQAESRDPRRQPKPDRDGLVNEERARKEFAEAARQLEDQASLREQNPLTNDQSALDQNRASRALDKLTQDIATAGKTPADKKTQALTELSDSSGKMLDVMRVLAANTQALDALKGVNHALDAPAPEHAANPFDAVDSIQSAAEALRLLPESLRRARATNELANAAQQASDITRGASEQIKNNARLAAILPKQPRNEEAARMLTADAHQRASDILNQVQGLGDTAREQLEAMTPQVSEMMKQVAQELKSTQQQTQAAADEAKAEKPVDAVAEKALQLQADAAQNAQTMESLQAALRQEANAANLAQEQQRQMSRTADVALAQMQKKAPQIAQNLKQASQASASKPQAQALQSAADTQQQAAQALDELSENMAKAEKGEKLSEQELAAMQKMEQDLAVEDPLNEAYDRAQQLAELVKDASQDPAAVLKELEKELPKNPVMRKALAEISKGAAQSAEQAVAEKFNQPASLGMVAEQAAHDLARVARHQQRLGDQAAAQQVAQASQQLQQTAETTKKDLTQATPETGQQAQSRASQAAKAAEQTASNTVPAMAASPFEQVQGVMLAQALDQLDKSVNPMNPQSQGQGQQQQQQGDQKSAQQSLSQAQQNQQQQMADARNQGKVPGSQNGQQQAAQNSQDKPQSQQADSASQSREGGNLQAQVKDGVLGGQMVLVDGDWGHLPSKMAEDLTEATRTEAAPEYRTAIESYYKAIATKAKQ